MKKNERWTEERGREVVEAWRRSGSSMSAFAERLGINVQRLSYWRDRIDELRVSGVVDAGEARLIPGVVAGGCVGSGTAMVVQLPHGVVIEVDSSARVDPKWLAGLVRELEALS